MSASFVNFKITTFISAIILGLAFLISLVNGHGMMLDPINRSSIWRINDTFPHNYEDNQNFCGGVGIQYGINEGHCGICGDNYQDPRPRANENGGTYGLGHIVHSYESGATITIHTLLTANHIGYFQYQLCVLKTDKDLEEDECFETLMFEDGSDRYMVDKNDKMIENRVVLPAGLTCERCVLRWHYNTGNSWGTCANGTQHLGCGNQEVFRSCSDITIIEASSPSDKEQ